MTEVVERGESVERAMHWANRLAAMPRSALRHTKRAMNQWLRIGLPAFDASWAGEILTVNLSDDRPR